MCSWKEAQAEYETTEQLAKLSLPPSNSIHQKIAKALQKVRMQVRNKVQAAAVQEPFIQKVDSIDVIEPENSVLWQPKFKPHPIKDKELQLMDIVSQIQDQCLKDRPPRHTHGQSTNNSSFNASIRAKHNLRRSDNLRRSEKIQSSIQDLNYSSILVQTPHQVDDSFYSITLPSIVNTSAQSNHRNKTVAENFHKQKKTIQSPRILSTQRDSRNNLQFNTITAARDEFQSPENSIDLDLRPFTVNPLRISLQPDFQKNDWLLESDLKSLTNKSKQAKAYLTQNFGLPQLKLPMDRPDTITKSPPKLPFHWQKQNNLQLEQAYYLAIQNFKDKNTNDIRKLNILQIMSEGVLSKNKNLEIITQSYDVQSFKKAVSKKKLMQKIELSRTIISNDSLKKSSYKSIGDELKRLEQLKIEFQRLSPNQQFRLANYEASLGREKLQSQKSPKRSVLKSLLSGRALQDKKGTPQMTPERSEEILSPISPQHQDQKLRKIKIKDQKKAVSEIMDKKFVQSQNQANVKIRLFKNQNKQKESEVVKQKETSQENTSQSALKLQKTQESYNSQSIKESSFDANSTSKKFWEPKSQDAKDQSKKNTSKSPKHQNQAKEQVKSPKNAKPKTKVQQKSTQVEQVKAEKQVGEEQLLGEAPPKNQIFIKEEENLRSIIEKTMNTKATQTHRMRYEAQPNILKQEEKDFLNAGFTISHSQFRNLSQDGSDSCEESNHSRSLQRSTNFIDGMPKLIIRKSKAMQIASVDLGFAASIAVQPRAQMIDQNSASPFRQVSIDSNIGKSVKFVSRDYSKKLSATLKNQSVDTQRRLDLMQTPDSLNLTPEPTGNQNEITSPQQPKLSATLKQQAGFTFGRLSQSPIRTCDSIIMQTPEPIFQDQENITLVQQSQDSVNSIASKIQGLNLNLDRFKALIEEQRNNPLLASSSHREAPILDSAVRRSHRVNDTTEPNSLRTITSQVK